MGCCLILKLMDYLLIAHVVFSFIFTSCLFNSLIQLAYFAITLIRPKLSNLNLLSYYTFSLEASICFQVI